MLTHTAVVRRSERDRLLDRGDGTLTQVDGKPTEHNATGNALSHDSKFLYVLSNQLFPPFPPVSAINKFRLHKETGVMTPIGVIDGLPGNTLSGLAAW